jgi:hypothetical protein
MIHENVAEGLADSIAPRFISKGTERLVNVKRNPEFVQICSLYMLNAHTRERVHITPITGEKTTHRAQKFQSNPEV